RAFHFVFALDHRGQLSDVLVAQVLDADVGLNTGRAQDTTRSRIADAVDVRERGLDPLLSGKIDACYSCDANLLLLLTLLVPRIALADHADHAFATHHLAVLADLLHRAPHFHACLRAGPAAAVYL